MLETGWKKIPKELQSTDPDTNRPFLLQDELDKIMALKFTAERLANVRDIFVSCCYTGLAYANVQNLRCVDIVIGHDGEKWIHTERVKTETATRVPLLPQALKIMDAYKDHPQCVNQNKPLPVLSNAKMNEYLKEIADRCEINKRMTIHTAQHIPMHRDDYGDFNEWGSYRDGR